MLLTTALLSPLLIQDNRSEIRAEDLKQHISYFASEELKGRESGKEGGHLAARYAARHFKELGLKPIDEDKDFLLPFKVGSLTCYNTAALLAGTNKSLSDQVLVIGGHHDHAGVGGPGAMGGAGQIHNGADDNASGSCGVLELAEYFVAHPTPRPILFMTFSAEERGLLGSKDFVESDLLPVDEMHAMLNLDMIGRSEDGYLFIGGLGTAKEMHSILDPIYEKSELALEFSDLGAAPSDNTSFYNAGVPALFFFTNIHEDYHLPGDDFDKVNYEGAAEILKLIRDTAVALNKAPKKLRFQRSDGMGMPEDFMDRMVAHQRQIFQARNNRGRVGIVPGNAVEDGLSVRRVTEGSAAEAAGVQAGDILLKVDGSATTTRQELRAALGGRSKGEVVSLTLRRGDKELTVRATLK